MRDGVVATDVARGLALVQQMNADRILPVFEKACLAILPKKAKRAEFEALKRRVDVARRSAEIFATKAVELRTELGLNRQQLVSPQLVQDAVVPLTPSFPTTPIKFLASLVIAFAGIAGLVLAPVKALSRQSETNPDFSDADARRPGRRGFGPPIGEAAARARDFT